MKGEKIIEYVGGFLFLTAMVLGVIIGDTNLILSSGFVYLGLLKEK